MWSRVETFIRQHGLLSADGLYVVALSGGADSVALLLMLHEAGYRVHAAHCNFHLRGDESNRDEAFCQHLCQRIGVPLHLAHFDTRSYADVHHVSIEMAARELRYGWFEQLRLDLCAEGVCVAHHQDDSVETILANMLRGTGLRGLLGIQPRQGHILRPLLCLRRSDIEAWLSERGQDYVTDGTNLVADVVRNKLRLEVLPMLREINPAADDALLRMADNLGEAQALLDSIVAPYLASSSLDLDAIHHNEYITFEWARQYGFNRSQVGQILQSAVGSTFTSPAGYELLVDRRQLLVEKKADAEALSMTIPEPGTYVLSEGRRLRLSVTEGGTPVDASSDSVQHVDADKVQFPLVVRTACQGDRMTPLGMQGSRLLSDMMTDARMTLFEKRRQLVVADARGTILWAPGLRISNLVRLTASTLRILRLELALALLLLVIPLMGCSHRSYGGRAVAANPHSAAPTARDSVSWHFPLPGAKVISPYGQRGKRQHTGVDIKTKDKDNIYAAFDGEVVFSDNFYGYGKLIRIKHANGLETYYSHNSKNLVKVGDRVKAGQRIALVGQTGSATTPHLHFEVRVNGKPRNPAKYFDFSTHTLKRRAL